MFKMKKIFLISTLLIICFISCDGRDRVYNSNIDNLEESNLSEPFFENLTYVPERYIETVTDTILSTKLRVNVKYYSLLDKGILISDKNKKIHFRQFESQISVFKKDKLLFSHLLNKSDFIKNDELEFWNNAILQFVWLDEFALNEKQIQINCSFLEPNTKAFKSYKVYFNTIGERKIELIESS